MKEWLNNYRISESEGDGVGVKDWVGRMRGKLRGVLQPNPDRYHTEIIIPGPPKPKSGHYIVTYTAEIRKWISLHRVWFWTFTAIAGYVIFSIYVYSALLSADTSIDELSFWDDKPEDARNLILVIGGWLGGLAAIVGFVLAGFRTSTQMQMTQTAIDGQVTERFTRAVEQLGNEKRAVRLGAIYALERIARDSARDRDAIVETLAAYIRELAPWPPLDENGQPLDGAAMKKENARADMRPPIDIATALSVVCRLLRTDDPTRKNIDLRHTDLRGLDARGINLSRMRLDGANLMDAKLWDSLLRVTSLFNSNLSGTSLNRSDLSWVELSRANLSGANLFGAKLDNAGLSNAEMSGADLNGVTGLFQDQIRLIRYLHNNPPKNLPEGLTLPEPYDG